MRRLKPGQVKLERALSKLGLASRTQARALILAGEVTVGGRVVRDPERAVVPETARIEIAGKTAEAAEPITIALNKPRGVVTTRADERGRPTVYELLGELGRHVVPVGRLDLATTGLLLMTNDTRLASWLTDPVTGVVRIYLAQVRGEVSHESLARLREGIVDRGERLGAVEASALKRSGRESLLKIELVTGKNREVRRLCAAIGHEVTRLKRIAYGPIELGTLQPGEWREISVKELRKAFPNAPIRIK
jgi:23S rRNA pseudouridine2605 synthase